MSKYFNKHYWLRKIFVNKYFSKFINQNLTNKLVFNSIYKSNYWNKSKELDTNIQSLSGPGSIPNSTQTNHLLKELEKFFRNHNVKKILDAPCGDCAWVERIFKLNIQYTGIDIVNELILNNKEKFSGCTVHLVSEKLDSGKIIIQKKIKVNSNDSPISLSKKILKMEHQIYPLAIKKII